MINNEEILRYDLIINSVNEYEIHLPVQNLINPKIYIKNDILFIELKNKSFKIINLEKKILNLIEKNEIIFKNINNEIIVSVN